MKKSFCILLNVSVHADPQRWRTEYYVRFDAWKHCIVSDRNQINFEGLNIDEPYARWSDQEILELGRVLRDAAVDMMKADFQT